MPYADLSDASAFSSENEDDLPNEASTTQKTSCALNKAANLSTDKLESEEKAPSDGSSDESSNDMMDKSTVVASPVKMPILRPLRRYTCVALVSGGKDSCFAMMEAQRWGHSIAVLANLCPARKHENQKNDSDIPPSNMDDEDLNSFMFQTVGHTAVNAISQAMGLPLVRVETRGVAVAKGLLYQQSRKVGAIHDEVHMINGGT